MDKSRNTMLTYSTDVLQNEIYHLVEPKHRSAHPASRTVWEQSLIKSLWKDYGRECMDGAKGKGLQSLWWSL